MKKIKQWALTIALSFLCFCAYSQTISIKGVVQDQNNDPLPGVNVVITGTTTGVVTNIDGQYFIDVAGDKTLTFSFIGYTPQTIKIENRTIIDVVLTENIQLIDEVVVIGYGTARKKDLTGSVAQVKTDKLEKENPGSVSGYTQKQYART